MLPTLHPQLQTIFDNATEGFVLLDDQLCLQAFNSRASRIIYLNSGKSAKMGASVYDYIHPSRTEALREIFKQVLGGKRIEYDTSYTLKDESIAWFHFTYSPVLEQGINCGICISGTDITSRKLAEERQALLVSVVDFSEDAILSLNLDGIITSWNRGARQIFGYTESEALGRHVNILIPGDKKQQSKALIALIRSGESIRQLDTERITKNGTLMNVSLSLAPIRDISGTPAGISAVVRDVTTIKKTQRALLESEMLYRSMFENNPFPTLVASKQDLHLLKVNRAAVEHYGYTEKELLGMSAFDLRISEEHDDLFHLVNEGSEHTIRNRIVRHRKKDGQVLYVQVAVHDISYQARPCFLVMVNDLTEQLQLQKALSQEKINRQKALTKATIEGQEKQRSLIGKELHDNVNQMLASAKMYLSGVHGGNATEADLLQRSFQVIESCMEEIRLLSRSLVAPSLGEIGLAEAIEDLVTSIEIAQEETYFVTHLFFDEQVLSETLKLSVYRILQEQLSNVLKHAHATNVQLEVKQEGDQLHIRITDNGRGFDPQTKRKGIGISNMINRAEFHGGKVRIQSAPGEGCILEVNLMIG